MASAFTWLDQSDRQRRKVLDLLVMFKERETVDELGLGTIRDAFADLLFPGTSAPQTRARYFFFVPWMYLQFERRKTPSAEIAHRARRFEHDLIEALLEAGESEGVIGRLARRHLQRLPYLLEQFSPARDLSWRYRAGWLPRVARQLLPAPA